MSDTQDQKAPAQPDKPKSSAIALDPEVVKQVKDAMIYPSPLKSETWRIEPIKTVAKKKAMFGLFKKKGVSDDEMAEMRKSAVVSPGSTQGKVQKFLETEPNNPTLLMLSAICSHGMVMNTASQKVVLPALKSSTKDAAKCLMSDGLSVYNCDNFFKIYFILLDRFKRFQIKTYEMVRMDPRLEKYNKELTHAMHQVDFLSADKTKSLNIMAHLKKKIKTSKYTTTLNFFDITKSAQMIDQNRGKETVPIGTAGEMIAYIYALAIAFARIPIMWPLTDRLLELIPAQNKTLALRRVSISTVRLFTKFKLAAIAGDRKSMMQAAKTIFKDNLAAMGQMDGQPIYQVYESDPFFNLAFIAELSVGLFESSEQERIINTAIKAVENVLKRDMSKNHIFTESANNHTHKLRSLKAGGDVDESAAEGGEA